MNSLTWPRTGLIAAAAALIGLGTFSTPTAAQDKAKAQDWPQRAVRLVLPFGAGSATDVSARLISERLSAKWKHPVVVDNRPGGDGLIAINAFVTSKDDHVLLFASSATFLAHPYTQEKVPYNFARDFAPIAQVSHTILSAAASAKSGFKTLDDLVKASRATPEKVNAAGAAGLPEFAVDAFIKNEKLKITKVPYRDVVQAGRDLGSDQIQFLLSSYAVIRPLVEAGQINVLALGGNDRSKLLPGVPSVIEAGYPSLVVETTAGLYGPPSMPLAQRERIAADVIEALGNETVATRIFQSGQDVVPGGPDVLAATIKRQEEAASKVAKTLGMSKKH